MISIYEIAATLVDRTYRFLTPDKKCSLQLDPDYFDGIKYTPTSFFDFSRQYFDQPELLFNKGLPPDEKEISKLPLSSTNVFSLWCYKSPFQTTWEENNTAYYHKFTNEAKPDTILLFAPGWARPNLRAEKGFCNRLLKNGIDSCLLVKPLHQQRTPKGFYSGELFISGNIFLTIMNFRQFISELQFLVTYFKKEYKYVGLIGMSSGGFQCGLVADIQEIDFYFPIITGASIGSIIWEGKLTRFIKQDIQKKGIDENNLNKVWGIFDQLNLGHNCKAKHIKQFISLYDEVVPTKYQYKLWEIYNKPEMTKMKCAHSSVYFYFDRIANEIAEFIARKNKFNSKINYHGSIPNANP